MVASNSAPQKSGENRFLRWINLREGEGHRTFWMFASYSATSSGLMWLEACSVDRFLSEFGAASLPLIYIASAALKIFLGVLYSWLQTFLPLRSVIIWIALLLATPLPFFSLGLSEPAGMQIGGFYVLQITVFAMQLWLEASHVLNDLNASITANQLFNIREIKRTYPLISSGILVADVFGGFSLPWVLQQFPKEQAVPSVLLLAFGLMIFGSIVLFGLSFANRQAFPAARRRREEKGSENAQPRLQGQMKSYMKLLQIFFSLAQVFLLLVEFQFLTQLGKESTVVTQFVGGGGCWLPGAI